MKGALNDNDVHLSVCLSVCLSVASLDFGRGRHCSVMLTGQGQIMLAYQDDVAYYFVHSANDVMPFSASMGCSVDCFVLIATFHTS